MVLDKLTALCFELRCPETRDTAGVCTQRPLVMRNGTLFPGPCFQTLKPYTGLAGCDCPSRDPHTQRQGSARQLQQREPGAENEEKHSVTEGPVGEIIRPRPQGSSPVYEFTPEGAIGFGAQENYQGRRSSSGRRRSWWKRDSGESSGFSSMSHPEEATEVTLKTEVESGASGYSVTGGGDQGIFIKQVLKDSSAAKLFSLREGDQLLSATIFFDHMKYEDALKILQYSEPYKVQFRIKRKLLTSSGEELATQHPQQGLNGQQKQDKDTAEGYMETPTKTLETDGDRERLISKSRDGRQRRPQDRLSWPKFQALRSKRGTGPRRSHSSSDASEHRDTRDMSPTSTDTEAQLTTDSQEQKSGSARSTRRFLNMRFGMSSGQGKNTTEQTHLDPQDRQDHSGVLQESQPQEDETQARGVASTAQVPREPRHSSLDEEGPGEMAVKTERQHRKKKQLAKEEKEKAVCKKRAEPGPGGSWDDEWEEVQSLEIGIARLSLQDKHDQGETQVPLCELQTTEKRFSKRKMKEEKKEKKGGGIVQTVWRESGYRHEEEEEPTEETQGGMTDSTGGRQEHGEGGREHQQRQTENDARVKETGQTRMKMAKFRIPSFGWSPSRSVITMQMDRKETDAKECEKLKEGLETCKSEEEKERERSHQKKDMLRTPTKEIKKTTKEKCEGAKELDLKGPHVDVKDPKLDVKGPKGELSGPDVEVSLAGVDVDIQAPGAKLEGDLALTDKDVAAKDSKFKMPKFKMPSFGVSSPGKATVEASLDVAAPRLETDETLPSVQVELKTPDPSIQLPSAELEVKAGQVGVKLPEGQLPDAELTAQAAPGSGLKGHLPRVQMPSLKMPKVDLKGPHVDLKGPKLDVKGPKGELSSSDVESSLFDVDTLANAGVLSFDSFSFPSTSYHAGIFFPKFHKPKFVITLPPSSVACNLPVSDPVLSPSLVTPSLGDSVSSDVATSDPLLSCDSEIVSSECASSVQPGPMDPEGKGRFFKLPGFKLYPFNLSPKKHALSSGDCESVQVEPLPSVPSSVIETATPVGTSASSGGSQLHSSTDKEAEKGGSRKLSFSMPRLGLPKIKGSKGRPGMPQGDAKPSPMGTTAGDELVFLQSTLSDTHVGDTLSKDVTTTETCISSLSMTVDATASKADLLPSQHVPDVRVDSKSHMLVDVTASQSLGKLTAPVMGDVQPSCRQERDTPTMQSPDIDPIAKEVPTDLHEHWFKMPKFRVPGLRYSSSRKQDGTGEQEATQAPTAVVSKRLEAEVSRGSLEEGACVKSPESPTYADVVKRDLHGTGSRLHSSSAATSQACLPSPELGTHAAKESFSLGMSGVRVSETQLPPEGTGKQQHPGPGGDILAEVDTRMVHWPSQPQGPLRLRASLTEVTSQVSVVSTHQIWEDSVVTVTFPKLKVPKFSFDAPSAEADVFFPVVREMQCAEAGIDSIMHDDGPGFWEASLLKTGAEDPRGPPVSLEQSLEDSPISKVRVHIQGSEAESQEVTICHRVEREGADSSAHQAFSTQIVRESEIPASAIQTPSYGFSLLKVKIPEAPVQASVCTETPDSQAQEGIPMPGAAGRHSISGDIPPDAGEPFEMISSCAGMPPTPSVPELPPGSQLAESTSDEEPAEILEFPEDSQEVKTPETATKQKPDGKKASLLWSWLPSIGFSSVEEMDAGSGDTTQRHVPVHVQPAARPDPELPRKQEKAGWFRFPKLGFSSPTKKSRSTEGEEIQAEPKTQEETVTFFDARESFSPEEEEEEAKPGVTSAMPGSKAIVASSARTELALLEQARDTGDKATPRPVAK